MMRICRRYHTLPIGFSFSHARHQKHWNQNSKQPPKPLKPYDYFLRYTYIPLGLISIGTEHTNTIAPRSINDILRKLALRAGQGKLNYPLIQKYFKVRIILLYLMARHNLSDFSFQMASIINNRIHSSFIDYKYSEIYEEGIISKLVETIRDYKFVEHSPKVINICAILDHVLVSNERFQRKLQDINQILKLDWKRQNNGGLRDLSMSIPFQQKQLPVRLFQLINEIVQYTPDYNNFNHRKINFFDQPYRSQVYSHIKQNVEQYRPMIEKEVRHFDNVRLTKWDYLITIQFIISEGYYSQQLFHKIRSFIDDNRELCKQESYKSGGSILFQSMLLCKIIQNLITNMEKYKDSHDKKLLQMRLVHSYEFYLDTLASTLENITFEQLQDALNNHFKIFQRYLPTSFQDQNTLTRFKDIYFKIFTKILDFSQNGVLLIESSKDINFMFEIILSMFTQEDDAKVLLLMEKYENLVMLNARIVQNKVMRNYLAPYLVCLKYGLKSDVLAEKLQQLIDLKLGRKQMFGNSRNGNFTISTSRKNKPIDNVFYYFMYLSLIETKSSTSQIYEQRWKEELLKLNESTFHYSHSNFQKKFGRFRFSLDCIPENNFFLKNAAIAQINSLLFMMSKSLQNEEHKALIQEKFKQFCKSQQFINEIRDHIAFPNILQYFTTITHSFQQKPQEIVNIADSLKNSIKNKIKKDSKLQANKMVYYQLFNYELQLYPISISDTNIYEINYFNYLYNLNPQLKKIFEKPPPMEQKSSPAYVENKVVVNPKPTVDIASPVVSEAVQKVEKQEQSSKLQNINEKYVEKVLNTIINFSKQQKITPEPNTYRYFKVLQKLIKEPLKEHTNQQPVEGIFNKFKKINQVQTKQVPVQPQQQSQPQPQPQQLPISAEEIAQIKKEIDKITACLTELKTLKTIESIKVLFDNLKNLKKTIDVVEKPKQKKKRVSKKSELLSKINMLNNA